MIYDSLSTKMQRFGRHVYVRRSEYCFKLRICFIILRQYCINTEDKYIEIFTRKETNLLLN